MIWLLIGFLVAFVIGFFIYFFVIRWNRLARYGSVEVPGESVLELPAGEVVLYYEDARKWRYSERPEPWPGFSVLVSEEPGGGRVDLDPPPKEAIYKARGRNRIPYATLRPPSPGRFKVRSQIDADAFEPRITFG